MTFLILFATVEVFGMSGAIKVRGFESFVRCEIARAEYERQIPEARFACVPEKAT